MSVPFEEWVRDQPLAPMPEEWMPESIVIEGHNEGAAIKTELRGHAFSYAAIHMNSVRAALWRHREMERHRPRYEREVANAG